MTPLTSYTGKLSDEQASALRAELETRGYEFRTVPYARFAAANDKVNRSEERRVGKECA